MPRDRRDAFADAFFHDMEQKPLGPEVVGSVGKFVARVESLETSMATEPAAKVVRETLAKRGVTAEAIAEQRALIKRFEVAEAAAAPKQAVSAETIAAAQQAQADAYEDLRDWFNDWATTLRPVFPAKAQIQLGLVVVKRGRVTADDDDDDDDEEEGAGGEG